MEDLRDIIEANMQLTQNGDLVYNAAKLAAANRLLKQINEGGRQKRSLITRLSGHVSHRSQGPGSNVAEQAKAAEEMIKGQPGDPVCR